MKKNPLFVAVSNQKGGVGKSTMLVTLASLLNYSMGKNVAIVDCDATQRSLFNLRERDMEMVEINKKYMVLLEEQRLRGCRIYPIRQAKPENARQVEGASSGNRYVSAMRVPCHSDRDRESLNPEFSTPVSSSVPYNCQALRYCFFSLPWSRTGTRLSRECSSGFPHIS